MKNGFLERIASDNSNPCVTISMKTHRTTPDNQKDEIRLKNLVKEASERLTNEFGKREVNHLLKKLNEIPETYDFKQSLDSLHIFLSNETFEIVKSPWTVTRNRVQISDGFAIKPLIIMENRMAEYLILVLSKGGARLFRAESDKIVEEIKNEAFPSTENPYYITDRAHMGNTSKIDNLLLEYFNRMDKEVVKVHHQLNLKCVVITTEDNYTKLLKVADKPSIYKAFTKINYNDNSEHSIVKSAWEKVQSVQKQKRTEAIDEMLDAVGNSQVTTDLSEIYRAAKNGRGELLIAHNNYTQAVKMTGEYTFDLVDDATLPGTIDDITSLIAKEVISKNGRVIFTNQDEIKSLGKITLKLRF